MRPSLFHCFCILALCLYLPTLCFCSKVNVNTCSIKELQNLPGIGLKLAQRIVEYRELHGGFKSIEELKQVKGIGEKKLEKIKPYITIGVFVNKNVENSKGSQIYYYTDDHGVIHFTHFFEKVPDRYRRRLRVWKGDKGS